MAGITLTQAEAQLTLWLAADQAVATNQSYTISGRTYTRADAAAIRANVEYWDKKCKQLARGGIRVTPVIPV